MIFARILLAIPAFALGWLLGTLLLGIAPVLSMDAFITDFHYSPAARVWVAWAGTVGAIIAAGIAVVWALYTIWKSPRLSSAPMRNPMALFLCFAGGLACGTLAHHLLKFLPW